MTMNPNNPLHAFAKWTSETNSDWSDVALDRARNAFIDVIAVIIPGTDEPVTRKVYDLATEWGRGNCSAIGFPEKLSAPMAALVNGTAAHALDFDDNFDPAKAHATAVLAPALLALADQEKLSGTQLLDAYIVGLQMIGRVGQGVNPYHRARGWHATATVGAVGSAAGCARLLRLNPEETAHAISLATSLAGGFMSQFGTMTKPLHSGLAAAGAVQAALFAKAGITAGTDTLHGTTGMGTLMVGQDVEELREGMKGKAEHGQTVTFATTDIGNPLQIEEYGLKVKRFPNCGSIHRALDGLLALKAEHKFDKNNVKEIFVRAPAAHLRNLMYEKPQNSMEAKFSLEFSLAAGLLNGNVGLKDYAESNISNPEILELLPLIRKEYVEKLETDFYTQVHVTLDNGETVSTEVAMPVGSTARPLSNEQLWDKFDACVEGYLDKQIKSTVKKKLEHLADENDISSLMAVLS
ncbi:MmgE/PrpD family protein [Kordiimonas sp. SCSIO 12610]|uniref:MmgE/PrpD family protein n=1 Tax=Kordiimonas sp. SCSIO 12610 TaxID=2829597 RepID=UPI00210C9BAF|nr:MmgE/PrpD family protein [Kordiimonas sp. SCSIO 12610]UTW55166.1 MmgE/PrpD family protein [Kordiimonas sp. SCSIO 12610]